MGRRLFLFIATNILVITTISMIMSVLGLHSYLTAYGIDFKQLALFCFLWGMGGAVISLLMSKFMAKMAMGVVTINPRHATRDEHHLLDIIYRLSKAAGLKHMPEVGIYRSQDMNAFATGPTKNAALVAISSGLLNNMNEEEIEAVLGHEISHIANGDMVTMTLIQGIINSFALFLSRIIAYAISLSLSRDNEKDGEISYIAYNISTVIFDILFTMLGSILVAAYSRWREYRADAGGAKLAGRTNMIAALKRLQNTADVMDDRAPSLAALMIAQHPSWLEIFSTHPPLAKRIERLTEVQ